MKRRNILFLVMLLLVTIITVPNANALGAGDTITYYGERLAGRFAYFTVPSEPGYEGTCRQHGAHLGNTDDYSKCVNCKAKLSNPSDSRYAKVIYEFWYKRGWKDQKNVQADSFLGVDTSRTLPRVMEGFMQIINMGASDFKRSMVESGGDSETMAQPTINKFNEINFDSIVVPRTLEVYLGKALTNADDGNNVQDIVLWKYIPLQASKSYASGSVGAGNAAVKIGDEITYSISWQYGDGATTITDTLSAGLQYVSGSSNMGEPSISGQTLTWSGLTPASGTLTYKAKVTEAAGGTIVCNSATASNVVVSIPLTRICNPVPKKFYGGTSYNDNKGWNHHEVIMPNEKKGRVGDDIKYKVVLPNAKGTAINVGVTDVLSKGLTYNKDAAVSGGTLASAAEPLINSDTKTTTLSYTVTVPAGGTAVLTYSAKVNEDAVNLVNNNAKAKYENELDIGTLHNPVPRKQYDVDTAYGMNGKIVQKDDVITYNVAYANGYKSNATVNLRDTLSKGLTYKAGTAQVCDMNKENCKSLSEAGITEKVTVKNDGTTQILWTRTKMPSLGIEIIKYDVTVTGETIKVQNNFDIKYCTDTVATTVTETIDNCSEQINPNCAPRCTVGTDEGCKEETSEECTKTKQECKVTGPVCNNPWTDIEELKNPVPEKKYNEKTPSGFNHAAVAERNRIRYEIRYANVADEKVTITIKDTISQGIEYVRGTSKINGKKIEDPKLSNKNKTLTWTRKLDKDQEESLTYEVVVTGETTKVKNKACMTYSNNPDYERCLKELENPVPQKMYSKNTKAGYNGALVKKNDVITYNIKYSNVKDAASSVVIMDNLSKGLEYVKGSARVNGKKLDPVSVTKDANGQMLVWMKEIEAGKDEVLAYDVKVTGEKLLVENNATIQYDDDPVIKLDELRNPLVENQVVGVPNTGSNIAIISVVTGIVLVAAGGYLIYRKSMN